MTYEVIVDAPNPELKLIPGMTANLTIYTLELDNVTAVPLRALKFKPNENDDENGLPTPVASKEKSDAYVWIDKGDRLVQTLSDLGASNSNYQQITSG